MQQANFLSLFRSVLTLIGSFIIGHAIFGTAITSTAWDIIGGSVITLVSTIWGIADKSASIEQVESSIRSVIISVSGVFIAAGTQAANNINTIVAAIPAIGAILQSYLGKQKVQSIANGTLTASSSTGKVATSAPSVGSSNVPPPAK